MKVSTILVAAVASTLAVMSHAASTPRSAALAARDLTPKDFPRYKKIAQNVYTYEGLHAPDKDGTIINTVSLIVVTDDGVVVVDGQGDQKQGEEMIDNIKKITPQPVKYMVIASDHGDHTGGNSAFKTAFPDIIFVSSPASQRTLEKTPNPPTETVSDKKVLRMGHTEIQILNLGRAHTGGDLEVYLPQTKVLFMSETYLHDVFPAMRSAFPSEWIATIGKAQKLNPTWYVPGHGYVDDAATLRRDLMDAKNALIFVVAESTRLRKAGYACESAANCPAAQHANWGPYGKWALSASQGPVAIARVYQELDGKLQ
jgi:glyoxylase-like metal-dependent hydrolase (beta-lactamase superfamily II)